MPDVFRRPRLNAYLMADGEPLDVGFANLRCTHGFDQNISTASFETPYLTTKLRMGTWIMIFSGASDSGELPLSFVGRITGYGFRNWPKSCTVHLSGPLSIAAKYEPDDPIPLGRYTDVAAIQLILETAGIPDHFILGRDEYLYDLSVDPEQLDDKRWTWSPGTTALEFIQSIDELSRGYRTYDGLSGLVRRRKISAIPTASPSWTFTGGVDIAEGSSVDWDTVRNGANGIFVFGQSLPDGVQVSAQSNASHNVGSGYLFIDNQRILSNTQAQAVADWAAIEVDRPIIRATIITPRDDPVQEGTTIQLVDEGRLASNKLLWVQNVTRSNEADGRFQQAISCLSEVLMDTPTGGNTNAPGIEYLPGRNLNQTPLTPASIAYAATPTADFAFESIDREVTDAGEEFWIVVCRDTSWSPGGAITTRAWSTSGVTVPETGSTERFSVKVTSIATEITLQVTDAAGGTASVTRACNDTGGLRVTLNRKIYIAGSTLAVAYDGSGVAGWRNKALTTGVVGNGPIWANGSNVAVSNDDLLTAPVSVPVFTGGETVTAIWVETDVSASNAYAAGSAGNVARSTDGASTWSLVTRPTTNQINRIIASRYNAGELLVMDSAGAIYQSLDYGADWRLITTHAGAVDLAQSNFRNWVCGSFGVRIMEDPTQTATWPGATPNIVAITAHIRLDIIYALANDGTTYYISPAGGLAMVAGAPLPGGTAQVRGMMRDGAVVDMLYIAAGTRTYKSHDGLRTTAGYTQIYSGASLMPGYGDYPLAFTPPVVPIRAWLFWNDP